MAASTRVSDADRERALALLAERAGEGYLGTDTLAERVGRALDARDVAALAALFDDLPARRAPSSVLTRLRDRATLLIRPTPPWPPDAPRIPLAVAPDRRGRGGRGVLVLGRSPDCDIRAEEPTVSRRHAELRYEDGAWCVLDLASRNGLWVNGRRTARAPVRRGDVIALGLAQLEFLPH